MALAMAVVLVFGLHIVLGVFAKYPLRAVILIEYSIVSLVWLTFALLWLASLRLSVWIRWGFLLTAYSIAALSFSLISLERWLQFGIRDVRTFLPLSIAIIHIGSALIYFLEWRISNGMVVTACQINTGIGLAFGAPFFALGALKLVSDALTFAGPILLHLLVVCLDDEQCEVIPSVCFNGIILK
uniref:MARVEL domain-containing protein n=1 Tax=Parascaris equorum TaxID=6256 RepID=A0A914RK20_PAREQ